MTEKNAKPNSSSYRAYGPRQLTDIGRRYGLSSDLIRSVETVSRILPFRVNEYVLDHLVDWSNVPQDPMFQLLFPQEEMLPRPALQALRSLARNDWPGAETARVTEGIRKSLNPHPSGQLELNVPLEPRTERPVPGLQHKYRETVLYFPAQGQSCHAYCTYCFRWAQFIGDVDLKFAAPSPHGLMAYLGAHPEVSDVLVTGGDPLIMAASRLEEHLAPLLEVPTIETIRIGTKALAYWPYRFLTDRDSTDVLRLMERIVASGRTCAVMAHFSHPREIDQHATAEAMRRVVDTGARIYCQGPLIAKVNDNVDVWLDLWRRQLQAGAIPYYMFVERDTGPQEYFKVPLVRAVRIFADAYRRLPGLARTVRGPVMSATPGKIVVDGVEEGGRTHQVSLRFLQARDPSVVGRPFTAHCAPDGSWVTDLRSFAGPPAVLAALSHAEAAVRRAGAEASA